jgi:hypothetical protein
MAPSFFVESEDRERPEYRREAPERQDAREGRPFPGRGAKAGGRRVLGYGPEEKWNE